MCGRVGRQVGQRGRRFRTSRRETGPDRGSGTHSDIPSGQLSPVEYVGDDEGGKRAEGGGLYAYRLIYGMYVRSAKR